MDYKFFFNTSKDALFFLDITGKISSSNITAKKYNLLEEKELFTLLVPNESEKLQTMIQNTITQGSEEPFLIELSCFPEMLTRTRWKVTFVKDLNLIAFCCEELSQYSPEDFLLHTGLMKTILDHDPNLIAILNHVGQYLFANKAIFQFAGLQLPYRVESLNQLLEEKELWLPGNEQNADNNDQPEIAKIELTTDPSGNAAWFENLRIPIKMPFGENLTLIISKDVSNWKLSEKRLVDHQQAIFHSNRLSYLAEMAGQIAHEINNPLTIILGNSQIIKKSIKDEENEESELLLKSIQKIEFMVTRIKKIIKMMRNLSSQSNTSPQTHAKVFDLISSVLSTLNDKFNAYEIQVKQNANQLENIEILCYPTEISQVFLNLFLNSIDAIVLGQKEGKRIISVELAMKKNNILISISNNGDEIKQDIRDRIFEPFFTTKPVGHGTGLGLSISKRIIEQHSGDISFTSSPELTTFTVTLPITE